MAEEEAGEKTVEEVIRTFAQEHPGTYLYSTTMPGCCSALMVSGFDANGTREKTAVTILEQIAKAARPKYAIMMAVVFDARKTWTSALKKAGWEVSQQVAKSNSYNGSVPMRIYIKSLRPIKVEEVKKDMADAKIQSQRKKTGYEW